MSVTLLHGDCLHIMPTLPANSIDSIVCDPPYGLSFIGKDWDYGVPGVHFWEAALRVAKPGAHLLAFGGTRTHHRLMSAIEDAGWEIRDCLMWVFGSGFPKSHDISKAIDKAAGAEREVIGENGTGPKLKPGMGVSGLRVNGSPAGEYDGEREALLITKAATDAARQWAGWGTALKPAAEIIVMARKPLSEPTIAQNVLRWGTGALAIDKCRIGTNGEALVRPAIERRDNLAYGHGLGVGVQVEPQGRWPANLLLSEDAAALLDEQTGELTSGTFNGHRNMPKTKNAFGAFLLQDERAHPGSSGGASRFFYVAKASKRDRDEGLEGMPEKPSYMVENGSKTSGLNGERYERKTMGRNHHPTVKPTALMRYLVRLVTPPNGTVLDPFMGSGSTGKAAILEGFNFVGIEIDAEYLAIAQARCAHAAQELARTQTQLPLLEAAG